MRPLIAVAMLTCDRRQFGKRNYFDETWASLRRSGFIEQSVGCPVRLFDAGPGQGWLDHCTRVSGLDGFHGPPGRPIDIVRNLHRAQAWLVGTGARFGLLLEDDLQLARNFLAAACLWLAHRVPAGGAGYSLCTHYRWTTSPENLARRWAPYPAEQFYGTQALAVPRDWLLRYQLSEMRQRTEQLGQGTDLMFAQFVRDEGGSLYAHCPNLVLHVGMESTIGSDFSDIDKPFPGEDYDPLAEERS